MKDKAKTLPPYGVIDHYLGEKAERYYQLLIDMGEGTAATNLRVWKPYVSEADELLDFGCGVGSLLAKLNCHKKVGVEINPVSRRYVQERLNIEVFADTSELKAESFSKVLVNHVLEHVPNPYNALLELRRVLRSDGLLLVLVPLEDWRAPGERTFDREDIDQHLYTWTPKLLGNLLWQAGFEPVELRIITRTFPGRYTTAFARMPAGIFTFLSWLAAVAKHKRQLFAVSRPK